MRTGDKETFISEPITPAPGTFDPRPIAQGEPGLPARFTWRDEEYTVDELLTVWKSSGPSGCSEVYLRRHWWELRTTTGLIMKIYFERQKNRKNASDRWFVYTVRG